MPEKMLVKLLNGKEHILTVEDAAERLRFFGLRMTRMNEALHSYEVEFPFSAGARSQDSSIVIGVKGTYLAIARLQGLV